MEWGVLAAAGIGTDRVDLASVKLIDDRQNSRRW
jgi:hypothetical protein